MDSSGHTAHSFDEFAHQFTDRFRVLALTRRGFGASSHPVTGYDIATRARDILAVADHFKLGRLVLVGHSLAGDEMTRFAGTYPDRVSALVYIDAAYDRSKVTQAPQLPQPRFPDPLPDSLSSPQKYAAYLAYVWNWRGPEVEVYQTRVIGPDGRVGENNTPPKVTEEIIRLFEAPDYQRVRAPALALYARPMTEAVFPFYAELDAESKARADALIAFMKPFQEAAIVGFRTGSGTRQVAVLDGNHYLPYTNETQVVYLMREFLKRALP